MKYKIYKINDFIRKTPMGEFDIDKSMTLVREIATTAGFHHDHNLLVDLRQTKPLRNFGDVLRVATEFAKYKAVFRNKIAFVIPNTHERLERARIFMIALGEVTFQIDYFTRYEEAIEWFSTIIKYPKENTQDKLKAIREYLNTEFKGAEMTDEYTFDREAQTFKIDESNRIYLVTVAREFIDDNNSAKITNVLSRVNLKRYFQTEEDKRLVFSGYGKIRMEKE